ncbi:MAG TPA: TIGR00730 family Rossman fold protein [Ilumatobacter sp.]|nr:TIGR00730 family Rossman fold protein [Ilumatobacter sp.]
MLTSVPNPDDQRIENLLQEMGVSKDFRISAEFVSEVLGLIGDEPEQLDLKIAMAALAEMRDAFAMFAPYAGIRKVTIFGSARIKDHDPLYELTREVARKLAKAGWMVVTGAGPGIMQAGMEGAGVENSIGVSIRLPFESGANSVIAGDDKHVAMKYFFTRKLMLVKESSAFVCLPGGFGTLDETFELLTLTQTGKGLPVPIVFLESPDDPFWDGVDQFVRTQLVRRGLVGAADTALYRITDSCDAAVREIEQFFRNYHSIRSVGNDLIIRMRQAPDDEQLAMLNRQFAHLVKSGEIRRTGPYQVEVRQDDNVDLARIVMDFNRHGFAELRAVIDVLNTYDLAER